MQVFHIATVVDWAAAQVSGGYTTSTIGRTLEEEGFLHTSRGDQWEAVRDRYYRGVTTPLVLLVIDTDRLTSPWREDPVGDDTYPHVYGPLNPDAVVATVPLSPLPLAESAPAAAATTRTQPEGTFAQAFLGEMFFRFGLALLVLGLTFGVASGMGALDDGLAFPGAMVGLIAGLVLAWLINLGRKPS
ncbi:MAG: DUF952 domain-containing protein [Nocardioides sp.]|uniref:DUF952 domain-containing protein n=1 Tax=Nocardioides sp. TaxID=35761 RepID=UPI0039E438C4